MPGRVTRCAARSTSKSSLAAPAVNKELLQALGDPEKLPGTPTLLGNSSSSSNKRDSWLGSVRNSLAKSLESLTAAADGLSSSTDAETSNNSRHTSKSNQNSYDGSSCRSGRSSLAQVQQLAGTPGAAGDYQAVQQKQTGGSGSVTPRSAADTAADSSKPTAGMRKRTSSTALAPLAGAAGSSSTINSSSQPKWKSSLKHYYRYSCRCLPSSCQAALLQVLLNCVQHCTISALSCKCCDRHTSNPGCVNHAQSRIHML
jgi:hypothetical protein